MRYLPLLLALGLLIPTDIAAQDIDCREDLEAARRLIDERWSFKLFKVGAFNLDDAYDRLEPEAEDAETPLACADVLARFMAELDDGHSALQWFPGLERTRPRIRIRSQREMLSPVPGQDPPVHSYVIERDTTVEGLAGILPGSEIIAVDGVPVDTLYERAERRVSGSTRQWRDYIIDRGLLLGAPDTEVELSIKDPGGARRTVTIRRPALPNDEKDEEGDETEPTRWPDRPVAEWRVLDGGWGYFRLRSFSHGSLRKTTETFDEAVDSLMDAPGMIIDLRGNGGGYVGAMLEAAGRFLAEQSVIQYYQVREPGQRAVYEIWDPHSGSSTVKPPLYAEPREPVYRGPVVVLIDRGCFSACEGFTAGLQANDRVLVIGPEPSGGGSGYVGGLRLPSRAIITFSFTVAWRPDGQQIEGNGVGPDIRVRERPLDWYAGRDRVLQRAIRALEEGEAPAPMLADGQP